MADANANFYFAQLLADGFPLSGGRAEKIGGKAIAALACARDRQILNAFVRPGDHDQPPQLAVRKGFHLQHWRAGAMQVWVVSDAEAGEVDRFSVAWRRQVAISAVKS